MPLEKNRVPLCLGVLAVDFIVFQQSHCGRGFQELLLREFKNSCTFAQIPSRRFLANATTMKMVLWAYDLIRGFQRLCLPEEAQPWRLSTLRRNIFCIPA